MLGGRAGRVKRDPKKAAASGGPSALVSGPSAASARRAEGGENSEIPVAEWAAPVEKKKFEWQGGGNPWVGCPCDAWEGGQNTSATLPRNLTDAACATVQPRP